MVDTLTPPPRETFLPDLLAGHAARTPAKPALIHPDGNRLGPEGLPAYASVSYADLASDVARCADGLYARGIRRGTRTAVLVPPGRNLLTLVFAMLRVGAVPVVVDPGLGRGRMLDCLQRVGIQAVIGVPAVRLLRLARPRAFAQLHSTVVVGAESGLHKLTGCSERAPRWEPAPQDLALIGFTTGSTGPAKPVEVTARMLHGMADGVEQAHYTAEIDTTLVTMALMSVFELAAGRTVVVPKMNLGQVGAADPALLADALQRFSVHAMFASPALLDPLARHLATTGGQVPDMRLVISGGAPVSPRLMGALRAVLPAPARLYSTYGATEALPMALVESREVLTELAGGPAAGQGVCLGHPAHGTALRLIAISDGPLPQWSAELPVAPGQMGEIAVSGPGVSPRYHRAPEADALHKIQDGARRWHRTGDVGRLDEQGRLWLCGRKSQRIRTARGDLHTVRCEGVFNAHPHVKRTALVGVGPPGSQRPVLCVELAPGIGHRQWPRIQAELRALARGQAVTAPITDFLSHPAFPVDIRHNAKIRRELLAAWATEQLTASRRPPPGALALRALPLLGWAYLAAWPLLRDIHPTLTALWWLIAFLHGVTHPAQIPSALRAQRERATGRRPWATAALTVLMGATWWRISARAATEAQA